jgi:hypothetical protein
MAVASGDTTLAENNRVDGAGTTADATAVSENYNASYNAHDHK